jgi:hypothetical protein
MEGATLDVLVDCFFVRIADVAGTALLGREVKVVSAQ